MNLLREGIAQRAVIKTTISKKLTVDGITSTYPVYKVKLDRLFYNNQNDRIATWISRYRAQNNGQMPDISDREKYNSIIEGFIVESNPEAIKRTTTNIELVDQKEPGVVLADGRIIDGNRRFTCLRRLAEKNEKFGYFETVILDRNYESNAKQIKMLELAIQHGEETKVDYDPIDRLVGLYNDVIDTSLLTIDEYASSTNESPATVKKRLEVAVLMVEFLDFINAPKQFYIARDLKLSGPLEELPAILKKCSSDDEKTIAKVAVFNNILMQPVGDITRYIREVKNIVGTKYQNEYLEEQKALAKKVTAILPEVGQVNTDTIRDTIRTNTEISEQLKASQEKVLMKVKKTETRNRPIQLAEKATQFLESIDTNILQKMSDSELQKLKQQLETLENVLNDIKWNL